MREEGALGNKFVEWWLHDRKQGHINRGCLLNIIVTYENVRYTNTYYILDKIPTSMH